MRLAVKLNLALVLVMGGVLLVRAKARIDREIALFEEVTAGDLRAMGRAVGAVVGDVWSTDGAERALELLDRVDVRDAGVDLRWVWLDGHDPARAPLAPPERLAALLDDADLVWRDPAVPGRLSSYVLVPVPGGRAGAIELVERMDLQRSYVRQTIVRVLVYNTVLLAVTMLLVAALTSWFVSRPAQRLIDHARRVGRGDLGARLGIRRRDELGELAAELDAMTDQLEAARARIADESAAKVAAVEQLRHADRLMSVGQLASGIAHELGTPLNVVAVRARMIQTGEVTGDEVMENGRIIKEQADRMTGIIRQLLDFARPRSPSREPVDLAVLARQTLGLLEPMARRRSVTLELVAEEPVVAEVDPGQIQQVLLNLAVNGMQAMPGGGTLRVRVDRGTGAPAGGVEGVFARLVVADEGIGMDAEVVGKIFDPFFTTKEVGTGTGLGLSVSYGIVRDHGGFVAVESAPGEGSRFTVHLPEVVA